MAVIALSLACRSGRTIRIPWPRFVLERPSGATDPVLLTPDVVVEDDPLRPRAAVEALLRRESGACG